MHCTNCGSVLTPGTRFCPSCGHAVNPILGAGPLASSDRLIRPRDGRRIAGVCLAISNSLGWNVTIVRLIWFLLIFGAGTGILGYIVAWIIIPGEAKRVYV